MIRSNKMFVLYLLVLAVNNLAWAVESKNDKLEPKEPGASLVSFSVKSTVTFADIDKNGLIDFQENKAYEREKLNIFDKDHNGKLNEAEKERFCFIDKIISAGGESLEALNDEDRQLYKKWRTYILFLIQRRNENAALDREKKTKSNSIIKCYPNKVCDDPANPNYGTMGSHPISTIEQSSPVSKRVNNTNKKNNVTIFYNAGLNSAMKELITEFERVSLESKVISESSGSLLAVRKVTELNKKADVVLVADELLIRKMLITQYADWYIGYCKDSIVLAFTDKSKYTSEINTQNWYNILLRKDVRFGYANPELAPIGYNTLCLWKLADLYYNIGKPQEGIYSALKNFCLKENVLPDVAELLHLLESLSLDYAFVYESTAKQHNLKYIQLPKEINLGSPELAAVYKEAKIEVERKKGGKEIIIGAPIIFALTIPKDAVNFTGAVEFVKFLLGPQGQRILTANDQGLIQPYTAYSPENIPEEIRNTFLLKSNE